MKLGIENRRQAIIAGILVPCALSALFYIGSQFFSSGSSTTAPAPVVVANAPAAAAAKPVSSKTYANAETGPAGSAYDPTLHPEIMFAAEHLEYTGSGRNIFSATSAPPVVKIQAPIAPARLVPVAAVPTGPPPPPTIPLKLFGVETKGDGTRKVFLLHNEDVFMAQVGDIVMHQYKVVGITANSVEMEDLPNNNKQTLPLVN